MDVKERARIHAALGDENRLKFVDALARSDRTFQELATVAGLPSNAAAHHLDVLEAADLIERRVSEGDHRRRYITPRIEQLAGALTRPSVRPRAVLFVCTHNSARSQFAAAAWQQRTGLAAQSAGNDPSERVHPYAVRAAAEVGLDLAGMTPKGYEAVTVAPDLVVSVCDRAHEAGIPFEGSAIHWSIPDPVRAGTVGAFRRAFADLSTRIDRLAATSAA
jgi:ArsR family transcriptional regulator, arsenate/arsenite/antimonite-responsive transcriptional repressor / arsenate reductase (thioredoxin)